MDQMITCINCPMGCRMTVSLSDTGAFLSVSGNTCPRGAVYARQECTFPLRMITAVIPVRESKVPLSVKTSAPVPKSLISDIMKSLSDLDVSLPVTAGDILVSDILHTGADIVATRSL